MDDSCNSPVQRRAILAWVAAHRAELPRTLAGLSAYPMDFRRIMARALPPEQRVAIWREHLETQCSASTSGSTAQRALIADVIAQLPAIVGDDPTATADAMRPLEPRMRALLSHEQLLEAFATLGPQEPPEGLPLPAGADPAAAG